MKDKEVVLFPESTSIQIGRDEKAKKFEIVPLVRKKYKKLFKMLGEIVKDLVAQEADGEGAIDLNNIAGSIPQLLAVAGDKIGDIYALVTGEDMEWIDNNMLPNQEIALITALFEQNDMEDIAKNFRKMIAMFKFTKAVKTKVSKKN